MKHLLLFSLLTIGFLSYGQKSQKELVKVQEQIARFGEVYITFSVKNNTEINNLPKFIFIDHKTKETKNRVYAYVSKPKLADLLALEIPFEVVPKFENTKALTMATTLAEMENWDRYPTYDVYLAMMQKFADDYPAITRLETIGNSQNGRLVQVLKITDNPDVDEDEPEFFYTGQMHGDELVSSIMLLRLIDYVLENYGSDSLVDELIDNVEIWINPLANPDGLYHGGNHTVSDARRSLTNGVDQNRNFPSPYSDHPDGEAWAQETIDMMAFAEARNFGMSCNIHSGAEVVNYPWDTWDSSGNLHADNDWWELVSYEYANTVFANSSGGYFTDVSSDGIILGGDWYIIQGGRQDYMTYFQNGREFTLELSSLKGLNASELPAHWDYNYNSLLLYMKQSLYGIRGIITDAYTGDPIEALVKIDGHDKDFSFVYSSLPIGNYHRYLHEGTYDLNFSKDGYIPQTITVSAVNFQTTVQDVALMPVNASTNEYVTSNAFILAPNPVQNGKTKLIFNRDFSDVSIGVYDALGKKVNQINLKEIEKDAAIELDMGTEFSKGVYFIKAVSNNFELTKILVK